MHAHMHVCVRVRVCGLETLQREVPVMIMAKLLLLTYLLLARGRYPS